MSLSFDKEQMDVLVSVCAVQLVLSGSMDEPQTLQEKKMFLAFVRANTEEILDLMGVEFDGEKLVSTRPIEQTPVASTPKVEAVRTPCTVCGNKDLNSDEQMCWKCGASNSRYGDHESRK